MDINVNVSGKVIFEISPSSALLTLLISQGVIQNAAEITKAVAETGTTNAVRNTRKKKADAAEPEKVETATEEAPVKKPAETKAITLDQVNDMIVSKTQKDENNRAIIKGILTNDYMAANARGLKPEDYATFIDQIKDL